VLLNYGVLLGVVAAQPAIAKNHARQAQMGNLKADIRLPHPGLTGVGQPLLDPEPPLVFTVIPAFLFQIFARHNLLLSMTKSWKAWRHDSLCGAQAFHPSHDHNAGEP
jgi:hypothetical protein